MNKRDSKSAVARSFRKGYNWMSTDLDGNNSSKFRHFSAQSPLPILFAEPAPMASSMNSAGLTCPGTGARQAERTEGSVPTSGGEEGRGKRRGTACQLGLVHCLRATGIDRTSEGGSRRSLHLAEEGAIGRNLQRIDGRTVR
jgi:hypothetical protein